MTSQKNYWLKIKKENLLSVLAQSGFDMKILKKDWKREFYPKSKN